METGGQAAAAQRVVVALRRSADAHDKAAALLDRHLRPERAAWHRQAAEDDRVRAAKLEDGTSPA